MSDAVGKSAHTQPIFTDCTNCGGVDHAGYACPCSCHASRTAHTPGPLKVAKQANDDGFDVLAGDCIIASVRAVPASSRAITEFLPEHGRANAHLFAAAPTLLAENRVLREALAAMLEAQSARRHPLGAPDEGIATLCVEAASKARAALAQGKGEGR